MKVSCPLTGKELHSLKDLVHLSEGKTGFASHNKVEATVFTHTRGARDEAGDRSGSLGAKGTVFR